MFLFYREYREETGNRLLFILPFHVSFQNKQATYPDKWSFFLSKGTEDTTKHEQKDNLKIE